MSRVTDPERNELLPQRCVRLIRSKQRETVITRSDILHSGISAIAELCRVISPALDGPSWILRSPGHVIP